MDSFYELLEDIEIVYERQEGSPLSDVFTWGIRVCEIEKLILKINNPYTRKSLTDKYV